MKISGCGAILKQLSVIIHVSAICFYVAEIKIQKILLLFPNEFIQILTFCIKINLKFFKTLKFCTKLG